MMTYRITAPHYCAGVVVRDGVVVKVAPILGWALHKQWEVCAAYFLKRGYRVEGLDME